MKKPTIFNGKVVTGGIEEPKRNVFFLLSIATYEIGDLQKDIILESSNLKLSLADAFTQVSLLCEELNIKEEKLKKAAGSNIAEPSMGLLGLLGNLHRSVVYMKRFPKKKEYLKEMKQHLSNLSMRLREICKEHSLDEEEVRELGWEHLRERFKEFKEDGWVEVK